MNVRWLNGAVAAAIASTIGCSGEVAAVPSDGGPGHDAPAPQDGGYEASPPYDGGGVADSSPIPTEASPSEGDNCQTPGVDCTVPPTPPSGAAPPPTGTTPHDYAIRQLFMGDTDRTGVTSAAAWQSFGYNLDNLVTTREASDVCTLAPGASKATQTDGIGGIDNSFGENILPILITTTGSDFGAKIDDELAGGTFTDLVYVMGFDDLSGNTTTATGLTGVLLAGGNYATVNQGPPAWNLATQWPIEPESLNGCPAGVCPAGTNPVTSAKVQFPSAYQKNGTFVGGGGSVDILLNLSLGGSPFTLSVHSASLTFAPNVPGSVTNGTIAGVLATSELVSSFQAVAGSISTSLCSGSAFQSIAQHIDQASDIVFDPGTGAVYNQAGTACNAISIGLGFEATEIAPPTSANITGPTPVAPSPCGDQ